MIIAGKMHMEEELANLFQNVLQVLIRMDYYVIQNAIKDITVLDLYDCPEGFAAGGIDCYKPKPYGRGAGYALW